MVRYESQRVSFPYFGLAAALFLLQIVAGLLIGAQYVWPDLLSTALPFNVGRTIHVNLMVFWLLLGIMGGTYYMVCDEAETELHSPGLAYLQLGILALTGVTAIVGYLVGWTEGREYLEAPRPLDWLIVVAALMFLYNVLRTILKTRRWTVAMGVTFAGLAGMAVMYLFGMKFFASLSKDFYFWWWVIHLWVEGTWELITAGLAAYLLIRITGIDRRVVEKWLYVEIALVLFTGILGTGHHYYWIGTPKYWLMVGGIFSALEPVPIILMVWDTFRHLKEKAVDHYNRVAVYWLAGGAVTHFLGAGVLGVVHTLPSINQWTHGTQITASHGHLAFYGAFGMLVIALMYYMLPELKNRVDFDQRPGITAFWLMTLSMTVMALILFAAGVVQTYLERILGMDYLLVKTTYVRFWMFWRLVSGAFFTVGTLIFLRDFLGLALAPAVPRRVAEKVAG